MLTFVNANAWQKQNVWCGGVDPQGHPTGSFAPTLLGEYAMKKETETKVDRSRLTLLLGLTSTAAAAGCGPSGPTPPKKAKNPYATFDRRNVDAFEGDGGGDGGDGGGGSGH